jgi:hypothetical protein
MFGFMFGFVFGACSPGLPTTGIRALAVVRLVATGTQLALRGLLAHEVLRGSR